MKKLDPVERRVYELYDKYCHGEIDRRQFFKRAAALTIGGLSALSIAESLIPDYAKAQQIMFTDTRIKALQVLRQTAAG